MSRRPIDPTPERPLTDILEDIRTRAIAQSNIQTMLRAVFLVAGDQGEQLHAHRDALWEGFAAIAEITDRECVQITGLIDEAQASLRTVAR